LVKENLAIDKDITKEAEMQSEKKTDSAGAKLVKREKNKRGNLMSGEVGGGLA